MATLKLCNGNQGRCPVMLPGSGPDYCDEHQDDTGTARKPAPVRNPVRCSVEVPHVTNTGYRPRLIPPGGSRGFRTSGTYGRMRRAFLRAAIDQGTRCCFCGFPVGRDATVEHTDYSNPLDMRSWLVACHTGNTVWGNRMTSRGRKGPRPDPYAPTVL